MYPHTMTQYVSKYPAYTFGHALGATPMKVSPVVGLVWTASSLLSAYHGAKRHGGSVGWALGWGFLGALFGPVVPVIGAAQGFNKCKFNCHGMGRARRHR